jgi:UDP-N-acetylmuramate dehydrogenase
MEIREQEPLNKYAWWKIGGPADFFCLPTTVAEVQEAARFALDKKIPITVLSGGTNVLISDKGIAGLVICTKNFKGVESREENGRVIIECLGGTPKAELTKIFLVKKLAPALFLCGLPGSVDGGVVMNAGVSEQIEPREFVEITDWFEYIDLADPNLSVKRKTRNEITWTYRHTSGWEPGIVVRAGISWELKPEADLQQKVKDASKNRLARQPLDLPSCGSVFKNPPGSKAGQLIDQCGLKGFTVGGAQVSPKHANFIVNIGGAKAADVHAVISHVKSTVSKQFSISMETEVRYLGRW